MGDDKSFLQKLRQGKHNEADVTLSVDENKRLVRLGIDPEGDPIQIMLQLEAKLKELNSES